MCPRGQRRVLQLQSLVRRQELPDQPETSPHSWSRVSVLDDDYCLRCLLLLLQGPAKEEHSSSVRSEHGPTTTTCERTRPYDGPNGDGEISHVRTQQTGKEQTLWWSWWRPQWASSSPAATLVQSGLGGSRSRDLAGQLWKCDQPRQPGGERDQQRGGAQGQAQSCHSQGKSDP